MPISELGTIGGGGGTGIVIADDNYFTTEAARDAYFNDPANAGKKIEGMFIGVLIVPETTPKTYGTQKLVSGEWENDTAITRGEKGEKGDKGNDGQGVALIQFFQPNHAYVKYEAITLIKGRETHIYISKNNFTSGDAFNANDWFRISDLSSIEKFTGNTNYVVGELIYMGVDELNHENIPGGIYAAKANFLSTDTFDISQWEKIADMSGARSFLPSTTYVRGELCTNNGSMYLANANFTSVAAFDATNWTKVCDLGGGAGTIPRYASNTSYVKDQAINNRGKIYIAKVNFTSGTSFVETDWTKIGDVGTASDFQVNTYYAKSELCINKNSITGISYLYKSKNAFTSNTAFNEDNWDVICQLGADVSETLLLPFVDSKQYFLFEPIAQEYNGSYAIYIPKASFISGNNFNPDDWTKVADIGSGGGGGGDTGVTISEYKTNTDYIKDQAVRYNNSIYVAKQNFHSGTFDPALWTNTADLIKEHLTISYGSNINISTDVLYPQNQGNYFSGYMNYDKFIKILLSNNIKCFYNENNESTKLTYYNNNSNILDINIEPSRIDTNLIGHLLFSNNGELTVFDKSFFPTDFQIKYFNSTDVFSHSLGFSREYLSTIDNSLKLPTMIINYPMINGHPTSITQILLTSSTPSQNVEYCKNDDVFQMPNVFPADKLFTVNEKYFIAQNLEKNLLLLGSDRDGEKAITCINIDTNMSYFNPVPIPFALTCGNKRMAVDAWSIKVRPSISDFSYLAFSSDASNPGVAIIDVAETGVIGSVISHDLINGVQANASYQYHYTVPNGQENSNIIFSYGSRLYSLIGAGSLMLIHDFNPTSDASSESMILSVWPSSNRYMFFYHYKDGQIFSNLSRLDLQTMQVMVDNSGTPTPTGLEDFGQYKVMTNSVGAALFTSGQYAIFGTKGGYIVTDDTAGTINFVAMPEFANKELITDIRNCKIYKNNNTYAVIRGDDNNLYYIGKEIVPSSSSKAPREPQPIKPFSNYKKLDLPFQVTNNSWHAEINESTGYVNSFFWLGDGGNQHPVVIIKSYGTNYTDPNAFEGVKFSDYIYDGKTLLLFSPVNPSPAGKTPLYVLNVYPSGNENTLKLNYDGVPFSETQIQPMG